MQALNVCMLVPGPEALQLAIWLGWRLHGTLGGVVAGLCFLGPSDLHPARPVLVYALHGDLPLVAAALYGLQATVIALIVQALVRIARRALRKPAHWLIALAAFVLMAGGLAPFPLVIAGAALAGLLIPGEEAPQAAPPPAAAFPWRTLAAGVVLWAIPAIGIFAIAGPGSLYAGLYRFFTTASLVTFGGAYAILAWVNQQAVEVYGWVTQADTIAGLALAETTPGPLIMVLQFIGYMAGWHASGGATATATARGAAHELGNIPAVVRPDPRRRAVRAAARRQPPPVGGARRPHRGGCRRDCERRASPSAAACSFAGGLAAPDWGAIAIAAAAFAIVQWTRIDVLWVIAGGLVAGLVLHFA